MLCNYLLNEIFAYSIEYRSRESSQSKMTVLYLEDNPGSVLIFSDIIKTIIGKIRKIQGTYEM